MSTPNQTASHGNPHITVGVISSPEETGPRNPQASYYRARYYDQNTARFLTEDSIGFNGGANFYSYVYNEPTDYSDPWGFRKYKCNAMGVCSKMPFGWKPYRPPPPPPNLCPVRKAFNDFQNCYDDSTLNNLPGAWSKTLAKKTFTAPLPISPNQEPSIPSIGVGDLINTAGAAGQSAVSKCLKAYPLAGLDPRFPGVYNVGKISAPTWFDSITDYLGLSSPVF